MFTVLIVVCHLGINPVCVSIPRADIGEIAHRDQCQQTARRIVEEIKCSKEAAFKYGLPPTPWNIEAFCLETIISEPFLGYGCP